MKKNKNKKTNSKKNTNDIKKYLKQENNEKITEDEKESKDNKKRKLTIAVRVVITICILVLIVDVIFVIYTKYKQDSVRTFYQGTNAYEYANKSYYGVGSSTINNTGYEKATIIKYDNNHKQIWKKSLKSKYNSTYFNVAVDKNDILAVGSYEKTKEENEEALRTAIFVKYNKDGEVVFKKDLQVLGNSKFLKVLVLDDSYIVVGQSIYPNDILGNDDTGGGIIIKYDKDGNVIWQKNAGGNKSGLFNDIIKDGDYFYVAGKDAAKYGLLLKYDLNGELIKAVSYSQTDSIGFSSIVKYNDKLICVGASKLSEDQYDHDTDGLIVEYNDNLEKTNEATYKDTKLGLERFNKVIIDDNNLVVVGHEAILDEENSTKTENAYNYRSMIVKYNSKLEMKKESVYQKKLDVYFTDIELIDGKYVVSGHNKYNDNHYKTLFLTYDKDLKNDNNLLG